MRRFPPIAWTALLFLAPTTLEAGLASAPGPVGIVSRIKRIRVESSALAEVGSSRRLRALEIEFRNGATYRYLEVEPTLSQALINAPSKARFYDHNIRRKYRSLHVRQRAE